LQRGEMDEVRDLVFVERPLDRPEIGDVALDERDPLDLVVAHDQAQPLPVTGQVERDDGRLLAHQGPDRPRPDAAESAGHEEPFASCRAHVLSRLHRLTSRPMRSISTTTSSPGASQTGGFRKAPTPAGVPVAMTSPGSRVNACEQWLTISATPKYRSDVRADWRSSPLIRHRMRTSGASPSSSMVTMHGPIGQKVSRDLPRVHCPSPNCRSLALTSFRHV